MERLTDYQNVSHLPARRRSKRVSRRFPCSNLVLFVLICFVVVSGIQAVQINRLLADARALSTDVAEVKAERQAIMEKYKDLYLLDNL